MQTTYIDCKIPQKPVYKPSVGFQVYCWVLSCVNQVFLSLQSLSQNLREVMDRITAAKSERQQLDEECQDHIKQRTKLELDIKDLERNVREDSALKVTCLLLNDI